MSKLVIKNTQPTSAQKQLLNAMAEIFDGKNIRYAVKGNDVMFVCKDVVEAAGGTWNATNFKTVVGEGCYTVVPLEISGISQDITMAHHKTILKWLTVSRLPATDKLADLVWDIVDKAFRGETINAIVEPNKIETKWKESIKMVHDGNKWGGRFIKFLSECGLDRDKYFDVVTKFFDDCKGDYAFKKEVIHKMRANFQTYKRDTLTNCKPRDASLLNVILLEVDREIESIWGRYEAHSRGQTMRHINKHKEIG